MYCIVRMFTNDLTHGWWRESSVSESTVGYRRWWSHNFRFSMSLSLSPNYRLHRRWRFNEGALYVFAQLFISYVCMCSVIYKLCMCVLSLLNWNVAILLFIECDANKIKTIIFPGLTFHSYTVHPFYGLHIEWILFNVNSAIFQLYHGENMLMTWNDTFFWLLVLIE